jgi:hypothetical protein
MKAWQTGLELVVKSWFNSRVARFREIQSHSSIKKSCLISNQQYHRRRCKKMISREKRFYEIARSFIVEIDSYMEVIIVLGYAKREHLGAIERLNE